MPRINTNVELNKEEQTLCRALAKKRNSSNRTAGFRNAKRGPQSNADTDLEGVGAEMAFCKLFNVFPDLSVTPRSKGDDDGDRALKDGRRVDVKATRYRTGRLISVPWKKRQVPLFALMVGTFPNYTFKGFMEADELLKQERLGTLGRGPTYIAEQNELVPYLLPIVGTPH